MGARDLEQLERRAVELCEEYNHFYVGTEHAFLAVLRDEPYLSQALAEWSVTPVGVTEAILKIAERGDGSPLQSARTLLENGADLLHRFAKRAVVRRTSHSPLNVISRVRGTAKHASKEVARCLQHVAGCPVERLLRDSEP